MEQNNGIQSYDSYALNNLNINLSDFPTIIANTCNNITVCDQKVYKALKDAGKAKSTAEIAADMKHGPFSGKSATLDALQNAAVTLAQSQLSSTEAVEQCFNNQKIMANSIAYLFAMGCINMTANRTVVREIQMKLSNASKEELSEFARQELQNVILQLKAQEDLYNRIEKHASLLKDQDENIDELNKAVNTLQNKYGNLDEKIAQIIDKATKDLQVNVNKSEEFKQQAFKILTSVQETSAKFQSDYQIKTKKIEYNTTTSLKMIDGKVKDFESNANTCRKDLEGVINKATSDFQESVPQAIAKLDEDAATRKEELNNSVTEAQKNFKVQLEEQQKAFQKELNVIRKKQNRKFVLTSIVSILVSAGIAAVLSFFV